MIVIMWQRAPMRNHFATSKQGKAQKMLKVLLISVALATPAAAQVAHTDGMQHDQMAGAAPQSGIMGGVPMNHAMMAGTDHGTGMSGGMDKGAPAAMGGMAKMMQGMSEMMQSMQAGGAPAAQGIGGSPLSEPGQSAFAAIAEVVTVLKADPNTDWGKVNIRALRDHLRDMDVVTIWSDATAEGIPDGQVFTVTGDENVAPSIQRMVSAHARVMNGVDDWQYSAEMIEGGTRLSVTVPESDLARLKALGFYGILASGMHHQPHHWMMATGGNPHQ